MADRSSASRLSARPNPDLRRRHRRVSLLWSGRLQSGADSSPCAILNLSNGGAKLRCDAAALWPSQGDGAHGEPARVELESARFGRLTARVIWREEGALGLAFQDAPQRLAKALGAAAPRLAPVLGA